MAGPQRTPRTHGTSKAWRWIGRNTAGNETGTMMVRQTQHVATLPASDVYLPLPLPAEAEQYLLLLHHLLLLLLYGVLYQRARPAGEQG